jgi:hypothetical protein
MKKMDIMKIKRNIYSVKDTVKKNEREFHRLVKKLQNISDRGLCAEYIENSEHSRRG